jgi:hypothetical protein
MAGTLTVQNLQGPSSGANANKIIVPSGQTLDASGGSFIPELGQIRKVVAWKPVISTTVTGIETQFADLATTTLSFTQGSTVAVAGHLTCRNDSSSGWSLTFGRLEIDNIGVVFSSGYVGINGSSNIGNIPITTSFTWTLSGSGLVRLKGASYAGATSIFGNSSQPTQKTQHETLIFMEIAQ